MVIQVRNHAKDRKCHVQVVAQLLHGALKNADPDKGVGGKRNRDNDICAGNAHDMRNEIAPVADKPRMCLFEREQRKHPFKEATMISIADGSLHIQTASEAQFATPSWLGKLRWWHPIFRNKVS